MVHQPRSSCLRGQRGSIRSALTLDKAHNELIISRDHEEHPFAGPCLSNPKTIEAPSAAARAVLLSWVSNLSTSTKSHPRAASQPFLCRRSCLAGRLSGIAYSRRRRNEAKPIQHADAERPPQRPTPRRCRERISTPSTYPHCRVKDPRARRCGPWARLMAFPLVLGSGRRFFNDRTLPATMRPGDLTMADLGIVIGTYEPAGPSTTARCNRLGWTCRAVRWR